jgi:hypothetical protein
MPRNIRRGVVPGVTMGEVLADEVLEFFTRLMTEFICSPENDQSD